MRKVLSIRQEDGNLDNDAVPAPRSLADSQLRPPAPQARKRAGSPDLGGQPQGCGLKAKHSCLHQADPLQAPPAAPGGKGPHRASPQCPLRSTGV